MARMDTVLQMYGGKKVRNKQVVLLIAGISGIATGIIVSLNIPFIRQGFLSRQPCRNSRFAVSYLFCFCCVFVGAIVGWILVSEIYYSRMTGLNESSVISEETYNDSKQKNQEFKIRKIRRNIEYSFRDSDRYFDLFIVFLVAGIVLWAVMHVIFDVCIDSWMADPKLT